MPGMGRFSSLRPAFSLLPCLNLKNYLIFSPIHFFSYIRMCTDIYIYYFLLIHHF